MTWTRYVWVTRGPEQQAQTLTVGHMIWRQATHALEHIDQIRLARRQHTLYVEQLRNGVTSSPSRRQLPQTAT